MLRMLAERAARGRTFWRKMPARLGSARICLTPDTALQVLKPGESGLDPMLIRLAEEQVSNGEEVWDIGANVGIFTVAAAARGAHVLAIEPDIWLAHLLTRTRDHPANEKLKMDPVCLALADQPGFSQLAIARRGRSANFLMSFGGSTQTGGVRNKQYVPIYSLDGLLDNFATPDFIKIDVERAETAVLKGGTKILNEIRPRMLVEVGKDTKHDVTEILLEAEYELQDFASGHQWDVANMTGQNILATPK